MSGLASLFAPQPALPTVYAYWTGASGRVYQFQVDRIGTPYLSRPGVYVFCQYVVNAGWLADYIGQTTDFSSRLGTDLRFHHRWPSICAAGSTHIGTLHAPDAANRAWIETDLIRGVPTRCNQQ